MAVHFTQVFIMHAIGRSIYNVSAFSRHPVWVEVEVHNRNHCDVGSFAGRFSAVGRLSRLKIFLWLSKKRARLGKKEPFSLLNIMSWGGLENGGERVTYVAYIENVQRRNSSCSIWIISTLFFLRRPFLGSHSYCIFFLWYVPSDRIIDVRLLLGRFFFEKANLFKIIRCACFFII